MSGLNGPPFVDIYSPRAEWLIASYPFIFLSMVELSSNPFCTLFFYLKVFFVFFPLSLEQQHMAIPPISRTNTPIGTTIATIMTVLLELLEEFDAV